MRLRPHERACAETVKVGALFAPRHAILMRYLLEKASQSQSEPSQDSLTPKFPYIPLAIRSDNCISYLSLQLKTNAIAASLHFLGKAQPKAPVRLRNLSTGRETSEIHCESMS